MSEQEMLKLEYLWAKCCDITQPMDSDELHELAELLRMEEGEFFEEIEV